MQMTPRDFLTQFPAKKTGQQKKAFRASVLSYFQGQGYDCNQGPGWISAGDPEKAPYLLTCRGSEPSGVVVLLEIARTLLENHRGKVCFLVFDGAKESWRYFQGRMLEEKLVFQLGAVGEGDHIRMYPTGKLKKDRRKLTSLYASCGYFGKKDILVEEKGKLPPIWPGVPYGVKICTQQEKKVKKTGAYDGTNGNLLRAALSSYISR